MAAHSLYTADPLTTPELTTDDPLEVDVTLYLRGSAPTVARERQESTLRRLEALADAGVLPALTVDHWGSRATVPAGGPADPGVERYEEFADAVGEDGHLDPFFEDRPGVGRAERVVVLPVIAIVLRREQALTGLYPCWKAGHHHSVEEALAALESGEDAENLT